MRRSCCLKRQLLLCGEESVVLFENSKNHTKPIRKLGKNQQKTTRKVLGFVDLEDEKGYNKKNNMDIVEESNII